MFKKSFPFFSVVLVLFAPSSAFARFSGVLNLGYDYDGNEVVKVKYTNGMTSSVAPGSGFVGRAGFLYSFDSYRGFLRQWEIQSTIGYKFDGTQAAINADLDWTRIPVELLCFYTLKRGSFRIGGGAAYHFSNQIRGSGLTQINLGFEPAFGGVIEGGYRFGARNSMTVAVKYTAIQYRTSLKQNIYHANSWGVHAGLLF